ncbi:MAG: sensor domain-containing diguanylate cyclase [Candidatus Omnitrophica bacterium]|nr:sensor domain-containing diguanylate cyclase [Candidatus Omnitrophota bacterium]
MTEKPKILSSKSRSLLIAALILPLVVFFLIATFFAVKFFIFLGLAFVGIMAYLIPLQNHLQQKKADVELQLQDLSEQKNLLELEISKEEIAIDSFREKIVSFSELKGLTEKLGMCLSTEDTSKTLSSEVNKLFGGKDSTIILYLFHSKTGDLGISSSHKGRMEVNIKEKKGDIFDRWLVKTMQPLLIDDAKTDYRFDADKIAQEQTRPVRSLISTPLMVGHKALGILRVDCPAEHCFTTEDLRFLTTISDLGAVAIENAQLYEHVEQLAIHDSLTNLYLRRYLQERLPEEISRHIRGKGELSFLMMDLDHFKDYNDKYGHMAGDIVLRTVGLLLKDFFNEPGSLVCRYGGEEFCVLIPDCPKEKAVKLAEEFRKKIEEQSILLRRTKTGVTVSIGVASFPEDAQMKDEIIHQADLALYNAKKAGRNRVCCA